MTNGWRIASSRITPRELSLFTHSLARLMQAGLPLAEAVRLAAAVPGGAMTGLAEELCAEIRTGASLSVAMERCDTSQPPVFNMVFRAMTQAAETSGALPESLRRLAEYTGRAAQLSQSVRSALIYPALLLGAAFVSLLVLIVVVIPRFEALFAGMEQDIPLVTRLIIGGAGLLRSYGWLLLAAGLAGFFYWRRQRRNPDFRLAQDAYLLRLPQIGPIMEKIILERVARSLSELLNNGVSLPEALRLSSAIAENHLYKTALRRAADRVREGESLHDALAETGAFPELMLQLVRVGQESSGLAAMLAHLTDIYALDAEAAARRLITLLEPALVILIGVVMAVIILGMMSAITGVNDLVIR
jgi:general secretion pathway protein F